MKYNYTSMPSRTASSHRTWVLVILFLAAISLQGCEKDSGSQAGNPKGNVSKATANSSMKDTSFPYQLSQPNGKQKLPSELKEISGLAWLKEDVLATVQDEKGNIYIVDLTSGEVTEKIDFGKNGDYEGIAVLGEDIWVVRSDGRLYEVLKNGEVNVYDTPLDEDFDVEGLDWYDAEGVLLLACKGFPGQGSSLKQKKTCYAFDPVTKTMDLTPFLIVDLAEVAKGKKRKNLDEVDEFFNPGKGNKVFQPSGVSVHPTSGDIYLISSVGKKLLIFSPGGDLIHIESLDYDHFPQPEGICFSPKGKLYISTEGAGGKGKIFWFDPI